MEHRSANAGFAMEGVGRNIGETDRNLAMKREKRGECPTCGTKTHKKNIFGKKTALTVEGQCLYGRCLICHPVEGYTRRPPDEPVVPHTIEAPDRLIDDDAGTMVSGITLDYNLVRGARRWEQDGRLPNLSDLDEDEDPSSVGLEEFERRAPKYRPEPSICGDNDLFPPNSRRRSGPGRPKPPPGRSRRNVSPDQPEDGEPFVRDTRNRLHPMERIGSEYDIIGESSPQPPGRLSPVTSGQVKLGGLPKLPSFSKDVEEKDSGSSENKLSQDHSRYSSRDMSVGSESRGRARQPPPQTGFFKEYGGADDDYRHTKRLPPKGEKFQPPEEYGEQSWQHNSFPSRLDHERAREFKVDTFKQLSQEIIYNPNESGGFGNYSSRFGNDAGHHKGSPSSQSSGIYDRTDNIGRSQEIKFDPSGLYKPPTKGKRGYPQQPTPQAEIEYSLGSKLRQEQQSQSAPATHDEIEHAPRRHQQHYGVAQPSPQDQIGVNPSKVQQQHHAASKPPPLSEPAGKGRPKDDLISDEEDEPPVPRTRKGRGMPDDGSTHGLPDRPIKPRVQRNPKPIPKANAAPDGLDKVSRMFNQMSESKFDHMAEPERQFCKEFDANGFHPGHPGLKRESSVEDIPTILLCLQMREASTHMRERAFQTMADLIWQSDQRAKDILVEHKAVQTLVKAMWADMGDQSVQAAAVELLFALSASQDGIAEKDVLTDIDAEGAVDALLISMQSHSSVEQIQRAGCGTLCCLARGSRDNRDINDGTLSGAVLVVVNAMDVHRTSLAVQDWGIRALTSQCLWSVNSDANRMSLAHSGNDGDGLDIILRCMEMAQSELVTMECACRLYWCLTYSEEIAGMLLRAPNVLHAIVNAIRYYHRNPDAASLTEAAYGALANLAKLVVQNPTHFLDSGIISVAIDSMVYFSNKEGVNVEACALLANLSVIPVNKDAILRAGGIKAMLRAMEIFPDSTEVHEEALRALFCLCIESGDAKDALSSDAALTTIIRALQECRESLVVMEMACGLLASLGVRDDTKMSIIKNGGIGAITIAMNSHPQERRLQEAACLTWRNISSLEGDVKSLVATESADALLRVMHAHPKSETVQLNACGALWNLSSKSQTDPADLADAGAIKHIVKSMQENIESGAVLEVACGALWSMIADSADRKTSAVENGGIDMVTTAFLLHPGEHGTLENACGVLSSISVEPSHAEAIANAQGLGIVIEAMRANSTNVVLLEFGSLFVRNIVLVSPDYASEADGAIATIINGMKDNPDAVDLQREACNALWAMAAQSESCKSKILALDGVAVIINTLDHSSLVPDVQEAARGAFSQLSVPR